MPPPQVGPPEPPGAVPPQQKRQRTGRRPAPLRGPKIDHGSTPGAHALPRAHPLSSHSVVVSVSPTSRIPEPERAPTQRVFGVPRRLPRTEKAQLWELRRFPVPRAAPAAESEVASSPRPRRQRLELVPAASGPLERDSCAEKKKPPTALKWEGGEKEGRTVGGACTPHPASICSVTPHVTLLHHAPPQVTPFIAALTSAQHSSRPSPLHFPV